MFGSLKAALARFEAAVAHAVAGNGSTDSIQAQTEVNAATAAHLVALDARVSKLESGAPGTAPDPVATEGGPSAPIPPAAGEGDAQAST